MAMSAVVFVKPSRAGSSVGITRVDLETAGRDSLAQAVRDAREHDPRVIIEAGVAGAREIECGVRQTPDGAIDTSQVAEISVRDGHDFYDFAAKYVSNGADLLVPADLSAEISDRVRETARRCFVELGCEGLARVDFFVTDHDIVVNEVNTMPGFTPISLYPRMWEASGVSYRELVDFLVREALARPPGLR
jgi:D-alanine-D-alanine ligase